MSLMSKIATIDASIKAMKTNLGISETAPLDEVVNATASGGTKSNIYRVGSIAERDALTNMVEGDLCVVHRSSIENVNVDSRFQIVTFPDIVVLDTPVADYVDVRYIATDPNKMFDCFGNLDSSRFNMDCYTDSGSIRIEYTSEDGITYTRTDTTGNPVDFGTEIYYAQQDMWNDAIGNFMQIGGIDFEGIFEYKSGIWEYAKINMDTTSEYVYRDKKVYTDNGIITGTITNNPSTEFNDINSKIYVELTKKYNDIDYIIAPEDATRYFEAKNLYTIPIKSNCKPLLDTSNTTNMSWMFSNCKSLMLIPLLDTKQATDMSYMFYYCEALPKLPQLDTGNVTNMKNMFYACSKLKTIPLLNTSNVTNMNAMFGTCTSLTTIPLLDTSNVTDMEDMFRTCHSLTEIPLINTNKVTTMRQMFCECTSLTTIPQLDTSNVTDMAFMFQYCSSLTEIPLINTSKATDMKSMFYSCTSLTTVPQLDISSATDIGGMFSSCTSLTTIPQLDTSNVTDTNGMFSGCNSLTSIPLLNTSKVVNMSNMFNACTSLETIPQLDTSNVKYTNDMFNNCTSLTEIPQLNTSNVTGMQYMFNRCTSLTEIPLLNTAKVTNMEYTFNFCTSLTTVPQLNTSNVTNMQNMFNYCNKLTTIPQLDTSKVTNMEHAFHSCYALSDESLNNILAMAKNSQVSSSNKTTDYIGLNYDQKEKIKSLSNYDAFIAAGWTNN